MLRATVDENGRLILPPETMASLGLVPGTEILLQNTASGTTLRRAATHLARVYIKLTSRCDLNCEICIRNSCTSCGGCDMVEANQEDCFGDTFPTCGGCLWAGGYSRSMINPDCRNFPSNGAGYEE